MFICVYCCHAYFKMQLVHLPRPIHHDMVSTTKMLRTPQPLWCSCPLVLKEGPSHFEWVPVGVLWATHANINPCCSGVITYRLQVWRGVLFLSCVVQGHAAGHAIQCRLEQNVWLKQDSSVLTFRTRVHSSTPRPRFPSPLSLMGIIGLSCSVPRACIQKKIS